MITRGFVLNDWIPALRSGKYAQTSHMLRSCEDSYCCLGVAADLLDPTAWTKDEGSLNYAWSSSNESEKLPNNIGITYSLQEALWRLNDDAGFTFSEIADVLEDIARDDETWNDALYLTHGAHTAFESDDMPQ